MLTLTEIKEYRNLAAKYPNNTSAKIINRILDDMQEQRRELNVLRARLTDKSGPYTENTLMPFGKYKGEPLHEVPAGYFQWWFNLNSDWDVIYIEVLYAPHKERAIARMKLKLHDYIKAKILQGDRDGDAEAPNTREV